MLRILLKFKDTVLRVVETGKDEVTIGRNVQNDIQIDNLAVSSFHARVSKKLGHYFIEDLDSTNGTFVNDKRITKWGLSDNDVVTIGKHSLVFLVEEDVEGKKIGIEELEMDKTVVIDAERGRQLRQRVVEAEGEEAVEKPAVLVVLEGKADQREYELTSKLTVIGSDETAGICLGGLFMPKVAGFIARDKRGYSLVPPEKRNKLKLNGRTVADAAYLSRGDVIEVSSVRLRFEQR